MTLADWQENLIGLLTTRACGEPSEVAMTPGFTLTRRVQREWRAFRIRNSLPLTCRLLGGSLPAAIDDYLDEVPEPSSFFLREAESFVAHHRTRLSWCSDPHVVAVSRFELAMLRGVQQRARPRPERAFMPEDDDAVAAHPAADVIPFPAQPQLVLLAAATGDPSPPSVGVHFVLCTPKTCRMATTDEHATFDSIRAESRPARSLARQPLRSLAEAGALIGMGQAARRPNVDFRQPARTRE